MSLPVSTYVNYQRVFYTIPFVGKGFFLGSPNKATTYDLFSVLVMGIGGNRDGMHADILYPRHLLDQSFYLIGQFRLHCLVEFHIDCHDSVIGMNLNRGIIMHQSGPYRAARTRSSSNFCDSGVALNCSICAAWQMRLAASSTFSL